MDGLVRQKLVELIKQHGRQVMGDYKSFETLLLEKCGRREETDILVSAVKEGIAFSLMAAEGNHASQELVGELVKRLEDSGMGTEDAKWAVESLGIALGKKQQPKISSPPEAGKDKSKKTALKWVLIAIGIVAAICLIAAAAIGIYTLASGGGHGRDLSDGGQTDITPTISPEATPTPTIPPGADPTPTLTPESTPSPSSTTEPSPPEESTPTPEPSPPEEATPTVSPPGPTGTVNPPPIGPVIPPLNNLFVYGNTLPNLINGGNVAVSGDYIYFSNSYDNYKLYKKPLSGGQSQKLCDDRVRYINVIGSIVYYINLSEFKMYKVNTDGSGREKVFDEEMDGPVVINDWVYFIGRSSNQLCIRKIGSAASTPLDDGRVWSINPYGGWIYYLKDKDGDKQLMKVRYDGTEKQRIASGVNISSIYAQPRKLLCVNSHPAGFSFEYFLFTINQDGTGREEVANSERVSSFINFDDKWIYYRSGSDGSLYRIRMDGTGRLKLVNEQPAAIHTGGGWVFYNHEGKTYMVKPDGTGLSELR